MKSISEYTDYHQYLRDYYEETKAQNPNFSYQLFSQKAGIKSKGFLYNVIQGSRELSRSSVFGIAKAMKLGRHESDYFENLVAFNQAESLSERNHYFERLSSIKITGKNPWKPQIIRNDQFEYYSSWYHSAIRSLIDLHGFKGDYEALSKMVYPRLRTLQVKKSVELLLKLGLVKKNSKGGFSVTGKSISTPKEVLSLAIANFHAQMGQLALGSLNSINRENRNFSGMTLGISKQAFEEICEDIFQLRQKIMQKAEVDSKADSVYQLNFQFFPLTRENCEKN